MKKIGIMGGSFNPIHNAHIALAKNAIDQIGLDEVIFLPAGAPYFKTLEGKERFNSDGTYNTDYIESAQHRLGMLKVALTNEKLFSISTMELDREGNTYTAETMEEFKKTGDHYYFIMGEDSLMNIDLWWEPQRIFNNCSILVTPRSSYDKSRTERLMKRIDHLKVLYDNVDIQIITDVNSTLSSTEIRKRIGAHTLFVPEEYLPNGVYEYIIDNGLYQSQQFYGSSISADDVVSIPLKEIHQSLEKKLDAKRYQHTLGVMYTAISLAMRYGISQKKAMLAGLLHDCAKYGSDKQKMEKCAKFGIELTQTECDNPALIHAKLGAYYAQKRYGVEDEEVLSAIRLHTTGAPNMTMLEKIVYLADYIEPGRKDLPGLNEIRRQAFINLDYAIYMTAQKTVAYLNEKNAADNTNNCIDEATEQTYLFYKSIVK